MPNIYLHQLVLYGNAKVMRQLEYKFLDYLEQNENGEILNIEHNNQELRIYIISMEINYKKILNSICPKNKINYIEIVISDNFYIFTNEHEKNNIMKDKLYYLSEASNTIKCHLNEIRNILIKFNQDISYLPNL